MRSTRPERLAVLDFVRVFAGGALGTCARFWVALAWGEGGTAWAATFAVNVAGAFWMGFGSVHWSEGPRRAQRLLFGVGLLGGFTTYSAFNAEVLALWAGGAQGWAAAYALGTLLAGLAAGALGHGLARRLERGRRRSHP